MRDRKKLEPLETNTIEVTRKAHILVRNSSVTQICMHIKVYYKIRSQGATLIKMPSWAFSALASLCEIRQPLQLSQLILISYPTS